MAVGGGVRVGVGLLVGLAVAVGEGRGVFDEATVAVIGGSAVGEGEGTFVGLAFRFVGLGVGRRSAGGVAVGAGRVGLISRARVGWVRTANALAAKVPSA